MRRAFFCRTWISLAFTCGLVCLAIGCQGENADSGPKMVKQMPAMGADSKTDDRERAEAGDEIPETTPGDARAGAAGGSVEEDVEIAMLIEEPETGSILPESVPPRRLPQSRLRSLARPPAIWPPTMEQPAMQPPTIIPQAVPREMAPAPTQPQGLPQSSPDEADAGARAKKQTAAERAGPTEVEVFYGTDRNQLIIGKASTALLKIGVVFTCLLAGAAIWMLIGSKWKSSLALAASAAILLISLCSYQSSAATRSGISYGVQRGTFVRGIATVTVPQSHQRGMVERPSILRLEFEEDENKHVVLAKAKELERDDFYQKMYESILESSEKDLLVFVHGYNVDFDSAVRRTAQIVTDLSFPGVPVCYSWPSQGSLLGYTVDENNVIWTVPHLRDFLLELAERSQARSINIIAHSMGNRAVTSSLSQISLQLDKEVLPIFDRVVLAAPDVDADYFRNELAPRLADVATHVTLYASSDDQALAASKHLHGGYPRAGESGANLVVVPDIETIDVSGIDLSLLGHSYVSDSESILRDLHEVVRNRLPASKRAGLISRRLRDITYWMLPRPQVSRLEDQSVR